MGTDKILHFVAGFIIAIIFTLAFGKEYGALAGVAAGVGKELLDYKSYGVFDFWDMFATILGTISGLIALHLLLRVWHFKINFFFF